MGEYKPLQCIDKEENDLYLKDKYDKWKRYNLIGEGKEGSEINAIEFFPEESRICAIASGTKIKFFDLDSKELSKAYGGFKNIVRCVSARRDGRLFVASDNVGKIKIIETQTRNPMRRLKGHSNAVHSCCFSFDKTHVLSGSDDSTLKYWDISTGVCVCTYNEHKDFIRNISFSPIENIFASASYDGFIKLWDLRLDNRKSILSLNHGVAVECIKFFSNGLLLFSAGGNESKIWDVTNKSKVVNIMSNHLQTITSGDILENSENYSDILLTSSLDQTIKWSSLQSGEVLNSVICSNSVLKVRALSNYIAAGMADGSWFIRELKGGKKKKNEEEKKKKI